MRNYFDTQLEFMHVELIRMGALCEEGISSAIKYLLEREDAMAKKAAEIEKEIDAKEREIENLCMKLLLQQQPVARDLRTISSALKMISDMERIGDQAADIAEAAHYVSKENLVSKSHIKEMSEATISMVTESIDSFVKGDISLAKKVLADDDIVDEYLHKIKEELIRLIVEDSRQGEAFLELLMIAKYLERIGDHATNIAEWVIFSITGEHAE